jgi:hypothetical protein
MLILSLVFNVKIFGAVAANGFGLGEGGDFQHKC